MNDIRWEGMSHDEIYAAVHQGPGAAVSRPAEDAWKEAEALIVRVDERIASAIAASSAEWEGGAADATRSAMTPLGQWALDAARQAKLTAAAVTGQGLQANYVRENMPEPLTDQRNAAIGEALTDPTYIFHGLDDLHAVEEDAANRSARAIELMKRYTDDSEGNRGFWTSWPSPPQITVAAAPAAPGAADLPVPTPPADVPPPPPGGSLPAAPPTAAPTPAAAVPAAPPPGSAPAPPAPVAPVVPPPVPGAAAVPPASVAPVVPPPVPGAPAVPPASNGPSSVPGAPSPGVVPPGPVVAPAPGNPGAPPAGVLPTLPGAPARTTPAPGWRDVIPRTPGSPGSGSPVPGGSSPLPPGARVPTAEPPLPRPAGESTPRPGAPTSPGGARPGGPAALGGLYPPFAAGAAGAQERERRRPDYLLDDSGAFADDRWFTPAVITPDDAPPPGR